MIHHCFCTRSFHSPKLVPTLNCCFATCHTNRPFIDNRVRIVLVPNERQTIRLETPCLGGLARPWDQTVELAHSIRGLVGRIGPSLALVDRTVVRRCSIPEPVDRIAGLLACLWQTEGKSVPCS